MQTQHESEMREAQTSAQGERSRMLEEIAALRADVSRLVERLPQDPPPR